MTADHIVAWGAAAVGTVVLVLGLGSAGIEGGARVAICMGVVIIASGQAIAATIDARRRATP